MQHSEIREKSGDSGDSGDSDAASVELKLVLIDFQCFDPMVQS